MCNWHISVINNWHLIYAAILNILSDNTCDYVSFMYLVCRSLQWFYFHFISILKLVHLISSVSAIVAKSSNILVISYFIDTFLSLTGSEPLIRFFPFWDYFYISSKLVMCGWIAWLLVVTWLTALLFSLVDPNETPWHNYLIHR